MSPPVIRLPNGLAVVDNFDHGDIAVPIALVPKLTSGPGLHRLRVNSNLKVELSSMPPLISVVVPTHARPGLVTRAVRSALAQGLREIEVVVVIDGPDDETPRALDVICDPAQGYRIAAEPRRWRSAQRWHRGSAGRVDGLT